MELAFVKMHGLGNDFIVMEDLDEELELAGEAVEWFCDRNFGIGADGLILVRRSTTPEADFFMLYYNSDGTVAEMCGNGIRCFAKYLVDHGLVPADQDSIVVETLGGLKPIAHHAHRRSEPCIWPRSTWVSPSSSPLEIPTEMRCGGNDDMVDLVPSRDRSRHVRRHSDLDGQSALRPVGRRR